MPSERYKVKRWWLLGTAATVIVVVPVVYAIYCIHQIVTVSVPNAYAQDWVSAMTCEYMKAHDGDWPSGWDDLRQPYEELLGPQNYPWSFDELRQRVAVDWNADPKILANANLTDGDAPFHVIWLRDGRRDYYEGDDPNLRILRFLKTGRGGYE